MFKAWQELHDFSTSALPLPSGNWTGGAPRPWPNAGTVLHRNTTNAKDPSDLVNICLLLTKIPDSFSKRFAGL
jgi:hypothetical protein